VSRTHYSPYKGLTPFQDSDGDVPFFFGREHERELVEANLMASRLTVLYGETGVGKSSLLRAGVAHHLRALASGNREARGEPGLAVVVFDSWRDDPVAALRAAVASEVTHALGGSVTPSGDDGRSLGDTLGMWQELLGGDLYVILDQAEEYFLYHGGEDGSGTFASDFPAVVNDAELRVNFVLAVRDDSLAKLDAFRARIPNVFGNYLRLEHLDRTAARAAIVEPVGEYNRLVDPGDAVSIEPELVGAVLDQVVAGKVDIGQTGRGAVEGANGEARIETSYLQLVLRRLWDEELGAGSHELRLATLVRLGGAGQIVRDHVERALTDLSPEEKDVAALLFDHLVTPSGTKIAHEAADLAEYAGTGQSDVMPVLAKLGEERILRSVEGSGGRDSRFEIFHDVLAEPVLAWKAGHETSRALEAAAAVARTRHRRLLFVSALSLVALVVLAGLTLFAFSQRSTSIRRERTAKSRELAASALTQADIDPELSLLLALRAEEVQQSPSVDGVLRTVLIDSRVRRVASVGRPVESIAVAGGGDLVVATARGTTEFDAELHRIRRLPPLGRFLGARGNDLLFLTARGLEFRGLEGGMQRLIHIRAGQKLEVHNLETGEITGTVRMPRRIKFAAIGPRGTLLAVSDGSKRVVVVNAETGDGRYEIDQPADVTALAFGPGAHVLATGGLDGTVRVWSIATGKAHVDLHGHVGAVRDLAFSPRATLLASVSNDGTARVFSLSDDAPVAVMSGHASPISQVAFSPDGTRIVTASEDKTARVWKAQTGAQLAILRGNQGGVTAARFVGDGSDVVTGSDDGKVKLWFSLQQPLLRTIAQFRRRVVRLVVLAPNRIVAVTGDSRAHILGAGGRPIAVRKAPRVRPAISVLGAVATIEGKTVRISKPDGSHVTLRGHARQVTSVRFSPDGSLVVTAGRDDTARIWDARTGAQLHTLIGHFGPVNDAEFSPDGHWVVTAGAKTAGIWSTDGGTLLFFLRGHEGRLTAATFAPAGDRVYTAGIDGTVRTYDCGECRSGTALVAVARARLRATGRTLTAAERSRFVR
jgi:WD40 repeat protein